MRVQFHKDFHKRINTLKPAQKEKLKQALKLFEEQPYHPSLRNHVLVGDWTGYRSISFGGGWRAHYELIADGTVAFFVTCGTHAQLYK